jgi:GTP-binding protein
VYTNAILGHATLNPDDEGIDLQPLFDKIVGYLPAPTIEPNAPTQLLVSTLGYDDYKGRIAIGRLFAGKICQAQEVVRIATDGALQPGKIAQVFVHQGLERLEVEEAEAGEIVAVTGLPEIFIGETIADPIEPKALPPIRVEEPTVRMTFGVNTSPLTGREGTWSTSRKLRERLFKELESNVSLRVQETDQPDTFIVSGRGELHLAILIETMRREGYEFEVARPEVIFHEKDGETLEPVEDVYIEVAEAYLGPAVEQLGARRGLMVNMRHSDGGTVHLQYKIPTRGLLGFRSDFLTITRGTGVMHTLFAGYEPLSGEINTREHGSLVAWEPGIATNYGLKNAEDRGMQFISPGVEVYEGMVVGQHIRDTDLAVNVCKKKHLTNMRSSTGDIAVRLTPPRVMSLDDCIEYLGSDELLEVTPQSLRIRKRILNTEDRRRLARREDKDAE